MKTKVTLTIDRDVIAKAKVKAREMNTSVSSLLEKYLRSLIDDPGNKKYEASPFLDQIPAREPAEPHDDLTDDEWLSQNLTP